MTLKKKKQKKKLKIKLKIIIKKTYIIAYIINVTLKLAIL